MSGPPALRRRRLGAELARLRDDAGLKQAEAAGYAGLSEATLSRIENDRSPVRPACLTVLLDLYGVDDRAGRDGLAVMAREGRRRGWWAPWRGVLPSGMGLLPGLEQDASGMRCWETQVIPAMIQTRDYALAVLRQACPRLPAADITRLTDLRIARQQRLRTGQPFTMWLILHEAVLSRPAGGAVVMAGQLGRVLDVIAGRDAIVQVLPFTAGEHAGMRGPFSLLSFPEPGGPAVVCTGSAAGTVFLEHDRDVRDCQAVFARLQAQALSPAASRDRIRVALDAITGLARGRG